MDYSKYENRKKYPSLREEKAYKMTLEGQVYKLTATGEEIKKMLDDIPNKVKKWKKDMIGCLQKKRITLSLLTVMKEENFVYLNQYLFVLMMANGLVWVNCGIVDF